ncbi:MAG: hypothetical protein GC182_13990 [Rhodopseudomonas sp.]|nr:hypothetical protein [Rhodopseudomonas sp.]
MALVLICAAPGIALAACNKSCTALKNGCISAGGNSAQCSAGYSQCLKTGVYAGMPSGRTHKNICKR